ncbi:conserved hypothetical protein [Desulfamplus magnetovallimortis]|uniref:HD domain-containing protein n=1 Tax=Desulfamplus magnetovallimortis TaxID=1246637 RepID=A0A1W1HJC6_9BACT|nr:phosphohydrolase [Desulfamplus magnetovallimortis]SLM32564.1 conserved hypothetical protein [Desulfamplus magnetovallimortis]
MSNMNIDDIIKEFYTPGTPLYDIFMDHAELVTRKSLAVAERVKRNSESLKPAHLTGNEKASDFNISKAVSPDMLFIEEAAMLHDIGIFMTHSPSIHCMGEHPYICHGFLGRKLLENIAPDGSLSRHALVCERHTGAGITAENIKSNALPLPCRDMVPETIEEQIICFADKFYSKKPEQAGVEKKAEQIVEELLCLDHSHGKRFLGWLEQFSESKS